MLIMSLDPVESLLLWGGSTLQDTKGSSDYYIDKTMSQINLSYCKV